MGQKLGPGGVTGINLFYLEATERTEPRAHTEMLSPGYGVPFTRKVKS